MVGTASSVPCTMHRHLYEFPLGNAAACLTEPDSCIYVSTMPSGYVYSFCANDDKFHPINDGSREANCACLTLMVYVFQRSSLSHFLLRRIQTMSHLLGLFHSIFPIFKWIDGIHSLFWLCNKDIRKASLASAIRMIERSVDYFVNPFLAFARGVSRGYYSAVCTH